MADPNSIVTVQVSTILAPAPSTLQQTGCFVSFGGTNQPTGSITLLTQFSDLADILSDPMSVADAVWAAGVVTVTTVNPLPVSVATLGNIIEVQMSGFEPIEINGTFDCTVTGPDEFTYPLTIDPGVTTVVGQIQLYAAVELNAMASTFYRQGTNSNVSVLELGFGSPFIDQIAKLENWLNGHPLSFYGYLLPEEWGSVAISHKFLLFFNNLNIQKQWYIFGLHSLT
jgi:hypothetical protein